MIAILKMIFKKSFFLLPMMLLCSISTMAEATDSILSYKDNALQTTKDRVSRRLHRVDREIQRSVFVPKGTWMGGFQVSYSNNKVENINFLVLKDFNMDNTSFGLSPCFGYFVKNNMAIGFRFNYNHSQMNLGNLKLNLGEDFKISLKDLFYRENSYKFSAYMRNYMPLSKGKIFAFFNEIRLTYGHSSGYNSTGALAETNLDATYSKTNILQVGFAPGLTAFVQDFMAIEVQMGVMGFGFNWQDQETSVQTEQGFTQEKGSVNSFNGKFKIDLFSISIGTTIYF